MKKQLEGINIPSFIRENTWLPRDTMMDFGWGNGYVILPKEHPCFGMDYDNMYDINCESELTFSATAEDCIWPEVEEKYRTKDYWIVGFDTAHYRDTLKGWPKERVQAVADKLAFRFLEIWIQQKRKDIDYS